MISRDEEWTTSKRIVNHKTRQVETRVQRQLVMEDGKVIADSGPQVITRIKENNHTEESENDKKPPRMSGPDGYLSIEGPAGRVLGEKKEIQRVSREVREENMQYHDERIKELTGHDVHRRALTAPNELITITDKKHDDYYYRRHHGGRQRSRATGSSRSGSGSRSGSRSDMGSDNDNDNVVARRDNKNPSQLFSRPPRGKMVHYLAKSKKLQDSDEVHEISKLAIDGSVTKEVKRTRHHEEFSDDEHPDDGAADQVSSLPTASKQTRRHFEYLNDYTSSDDSGPSDRDDTGRKHQHQNQNHIHIHRQHQHKQQHGSSSNNNNKSPVPYESGRSRHSGHYDASSSISSNKQRHQQSSSATTTSTSHEGHVKHYKTRKEKAFPRYTIEPLVDHSAAPIDNYRGDST